MKKNTAIICLSPYHGGMEMDAVKTALMLKDDAQVSFVAKEGTPLDEKYRTSLENAGIKFHTIEFRLSLGLSLITKLRNIIQSENIGNIIFFGASELKSLYFSLLGLETNLIVRHGTTKTRKKKDPFHRLVYSRVNWHVAICKHIANNVREIIPLKKRNKLKIIYSSLRKQPSPITENKQSVKTVNILHIGRVTDGKGQIDAIKACSILHRHNIAFNLILVGEVDPSHQPIIQATIKNTSFPDSVQIVGFTQNPQEFFKKSDIYLFPTKGEGLSNSFIEALSFGLVPVAYNNTSFPELSELGFKIFLAEDRDLSSLETTLYDAYQHWIMNGRIMDNVFLAQKLFCAKREKAEYLQIMK